VEAEAKIILTYDDAKEAKAVSQAVSPDNAGAPKELFIKTEVKGNRVVTTVRYEGERVETFLSTIDDLLSCASTAEKTILVLKKEH